MLKTKLLVILVIWVSVIGLCTPVTPRFERRMKRFPNLNLTRTRTRTFKTVSAPRERLDGVESREMTVPRVIHDSYERPNWTMTSDMRANDPQVSHPAKKSPRPVYETLVTPQNKTTRNVDDNLTKDVIRNATERPSFVKTVTPIAMWVLQQQSAPMNKSGAPQLPSGQVHGCPEGEGCREGAANHTSTEEDVNLRKGGDDSASPLFPPGPANGTHAHPTSRDTFLSLLGRHASGMKRVPMKNCPTTPAKGKNAAASTHYNL